MTTLLVVLALVTSVMVVVNLLTNLWARQHYLVISLWATGVLLAVAWLAGITWSQLGLGFGGNAQTKGLIWSAALIGIVSVGYAIAAALPWTRKGFADARTAQMGVGKFLYHCFLRIPVGTALMEEVAFRGVLLAAVSLAANFTLCRTRPGVDMSPMLTLSSLLVAAGSRSKIAWRS